MTDRYAVLVVPTGVGASVGGFAGDAGQIARKLSKHTKLIVNPNVVNAAVFSAINGNMLYTEGLSICRLFKGEIALKPSFNNKIGVIFDKAIPENVRNIHINTINAVKTVYGIDIPFVEITEEEAGVEYEFTNHKNSTGTLKNPKTLLKSAKKLIEKGAEAVAVVCHFKDCEADEYENGEGADIIGGIEAVISHFLTKELNVPVAHAPAFSDFQITDKIVHEKAAAEYITPTFLPCVLLGLENAPKIVPIKEISDENLITYKNISALIMPYNALGSSIVLDAVEKKIPVLAVKENKSLLNINKYTLNFSDDIIEIASYDDCINYF